MAKEFQPYFICGAPRSGTTLLLDFLTVTRETGWIPDLLAKHPDKLMLASRVKRQHWPLLGDFWLERRYAWKRVTSPSEGSEFWDHYLPGFTPKVDHPTAPLVSDYTEEQLETARDAVEGVCRRQGVSTFIGHYMGFPRVDLMRTLFPNAKFIQLLRNPRSIAFRMVRRFEQTNHDLFDNRDAWTGLMPEELQNRLTELDPTPLNFCGVLIRWYHTLYSEAFAEIPDEDWTEVAYSDLVAFPEPTLKRTFNFMDIKYSNRFAYYLKYHEVQTSNNRTKLSLDEVETEQLDRAVAPLEATGSS